MSVSRCFRVFMLLVLVLSSLGRVAPTAQAEVVPAPALDSPAAPLALAAAEPANWPAGCGGLLATGSSSTPRPILDPGRLTSTITVTTAASFVWNVTVTTTITDTQPGDLAIYLISPQGTEVTLSSNNGGSLRNVFNGVLWSDQAGAVNPPGPVTDNTLANSPESPVVPEEALGAFYGENPNGGWKLVIVDDTDNGSTGNRLNWAVNVEALTTAPFEVAWQEAFAVPQTINDGAQLTRNKHFGLLRDWPISRVSFSTTISHTMPGDLSIYLVSPGGISTTLTTGNGGALAGLFRGTDWDDTAGATNPPGAITDNALADGVAESPVVPEGALSAFRGSHAAWGTWQLVIKDAANGTGGVLEAATVLVRQTTCLPDLELGMPIETGSPVTGQPVNYYTQVLNLGLAATGSVMTHTLSDVTRFVSLQTGPGWTCAHPAVGSLGGQITCSSEPLPFGVIYYPYTLTLSMPSVPQVFTQTVQVDVNGPDAADSNNYYDIVQSATVVSANGNHWDVRDRLWRNYGTYGSSGALSDGGQGAFNTFGGLRMFVITETAQGNFDTAEIVNLGLTYSPGHRWTSTTPVSSGGVAVTRSLYAPVGTDYLRYLDTFTNHAAVPRTVYVAWGGALRTYTGTYVADSSSGDTTLGVTDQWGVTRSGQAPDPAEEPPVGYAFRSAGDTSFWGPGVYQTVPITTPYTGGSHLTFVFKLELAPGETQSLAYFLYRGLEEGTPGPDDCDYRLDHPCRTPEAGTEVAAAISAMEALAAAPDFCDLSGEARAQIVNWPGAQLACRTFLPGVMK